MTGSGQTFRFDSIEFHPRKRSWRASRLTWDFRQLLDIFVFGADEHFSSQYFLYHFSFHIRQSKITSLETEREFRVIEAEQVQDCRVQIVDVDFVFDHVETEIMGLADSDAAFDAPHCQPDRTRLRVMIRAQVAREVTVALA